MDGGAGVGVEVAMENLPELSPPSSPKRLRRLRKVREVEIKESDVLVAEMSGDVDERLERRETAEEILKRFGKGGDVGCEGGKKRKAVQSTIMAAVVDMAKQMDMAKRTEVVAVQEEVEEVTRVEDVEREGGGLELESQGEGVQSQGEELAAGSEGDILQSL